MKLCSGKTYVMPVGYGSVMAKKDAIKYNKYTWGSKLKQSTVC